MVMSVDHEAIRSWCKHPPTHRLTPDTHARTHTHPHADSHHDTNRLVVAELHVYERIVEVDGHEAGWTL